MNDQVLSRFSFFERILHWLVGITFLLLLMTGLAFAYPAVFWMTAVLGGAESARVLHPWCGLVFGLGMAVMVGIWLRDMFLSSSDWEWLGAVKYYATRQSKLVPPAGKYNAGQKMFFWVQGVLAIVFVVSGVALWFPDVSGAVVVQWMRLVHYAATLGGGLFLILHIYLGTVAYPGTARAMIDGTVTARWARHHHPRWYKEQAGS